MNFEPQKLFIGLIDFFSILLPGALLTWLLMDDVGPILLGNRYGHLDGTQAWAAFLFSSYLFGHLVFLLGTWLDEFYAWARGHTLNQQVRLLAFHDQLLPWPVRLGLWAVFRSEDDLAVSTAGKIKQHWLGPLQAAQAVNTFQWCKAWLTSENEAALQGVQRLEADSKFFRSLVVVMVAILVSPAWSPSRSPLLLAAAAGLLLLALWRYMEQRWKATNLAYWSVITLTARKGELRLKRPQAEGSSGPTHAGGVVLRGHGSRTWVLLVEASDDPRQWVLPKGHIQAGENPRQTAVREVHEEAGVWARIAGELRDVSYSRSGKAIRVRFFAMRMIGTGRRRDRHRKPHWVRLSMAGSIGNPLKLHEETFDLLLGLASGSLQPCNT